LGWLLPWFCPIVALCLQPFEPDIDLTFVLLAMLIAVMAAR
jgi:hypothetical protein